MSTGIVNCSAALRFSVLTPHIVRVEYSPTFIFEDRATLTFLRRTFDSAPKYTATNSSAGDKAWCNITVFDDKGIVSIESAVQRHSHDPLASLQMRGPGWQLRGAMPCFD